MSQLNAQEVWVEAAKQDNSLLPNKKSLDLCKGNDGLKLNPEGGVCVVYDMQFSDYITDYDTRRINGLKGDNLNGNDGWGASAYGVFQDVYYDYKTYTLGRHRSLAYRLHKEKTYAGRIGEFGNATTSSWLTTGEALDNVAQQMAKVKDGVDKKVIGVDMDKYNFMCMCTGHRSGRAVSIGEYQDQIFDGDCEHYNWVAQPGPYAGGDIPPQFAPIQCIELDTQFMFESLNALNVAWAAVGIDASECVILLDPQYAYKIRQNVINPFPTDGARQELIDGVNIKNGYKMGGFNFAFDVPISYFPKIWTDANLNVVHSADGEASYDKYINSITPSDDDINPLRTKLIASHRMGVNNFVRTVWDSAQNKFVKKVYNYPLGETGAVDYYGEKLENDFANYKKPNQPINVGTPGAGYGISGKGEGGGYAEATGPIKPITKHQVIGIALYPKAVAASQMYSNIVTDDGKTRGKFIEMCWDVKYDCWVLDHLSAGVMPIIAINDKEIPTFGVTVRNTEDNPVITKEVTE